uniref:Uncharacterized protein n=1 Tax=Kalanchoe fedtschenkoi TaxID=63787 RepID=A0A7N0UVM9_KALFE
MESLRPKYIHAAAAAATRSYEPGNMKTDPADEHEFLQKGKPIWSRKSVKAGPSTPVHPWTIHKEAAAHDNPTFVKLNPSASSPSAPPKNPSLSPVSARKLAAALWEFQFFAPLGGKMHRGSSAHQAPPRLRRGETDKDKGVDHPAEDLFPDQPETASSLKRHIAAALMRHHRSMDKHKVSQQPLSPASYSSSMEITRYNPIIPPSPTSSLELKGRIGESSYSLKTSTELLKVLNRIWSLEEQHASSVSLIKALRMELHNARSKIKELVRDQQADRLEIEELVKQITEDKVIRKNKEQDRAIQSTRDELEKERQLRKRSESLHRKLAHELIEAKSSFSDALKELDRERTSRVLLEGLCDEFAKGIKDYELEVHALRQKLPEKERSNGPDRDRLILHVSEAWIDERMQMKIREAQTGSMEKYSVVDKLRPEVEKFLRARHSRPSEIAGQKLNRNSRESRLRRSSMESVPMNDVVSGPQDVGDEDSVDGDSHCFELNKPAHDNKRSEGVLAEGLASTSHADQKPVHRERMKSRNPADLQVKFEEQMSWAVSNEDNDYQLRDAEEEHAEKLKPGRAGGSQKSEICATAEDGSYTMLSHGNQESSSNYTIEHLIRNQQLMSEGGSMHLKKDPRDTSSYRKRASPVRQWMSRQAPSDPNTAESSSKNAPGVKENTLKAKLLEARMKGQRSRLKGP